jgi:hypothetical protein
MLAGTQARESAIPPNHHEPGGEGAAMRIEARGATPQLQEQVLQNLFRCLGIAQGPHEHGEEHAGIPVIERGERAFISCHHPLDQGRVRNMLRRRSHDASLRLRNRYAVSDINGLQIRPEMSGIVSDLLVNSWGS